MKEDAETYFAPLTREQILAAPRGRWSDYELLDVQENFDKSGQ